MEKSFSLKCKLIDKGIEWEYKNRTYKHLNLCLHNIHSRVERYYKKNYVCVDVKFKGDFIITTSQIHMCNISYNNFKYVVSFSDSIRAGEDLYKILMEYIDKKKHKEYDIDFDDIEGMCIFEKFNPTDDIYMKQTINDPEKALDFDECTLEIT